MPRYITELARLHEGLRRFYHVTTRGNSGQYIYEWHRDREKFLALLAVKSVNSGGFIMRTA